jgi:hypothetical protein
MGDYKPSQIVVSLCKKIVEVPIAEAIRLDGTVVIITADGRKLIFSKDDITRILTGPAVAIPANSAEIGHLDDAQTKLAAREAKKAEREAKKAAEREAKKGSHAE